MVKNPVGCDTRRLSYVVRSRGWHYWTGGVEVEAIVVRYEKVRWTVLIIGIHVVLEGRYPLGRPKAEWTATGCAELSVSSR